MKIETNTYPKPLAGLIEYCAFNFNTTPEAIKSKIRKREVVMARHFYRYLARTYFGGYYSLATIGSLLQNSDHANVQHSCTVVINAISTEGKKVGSWGNKFKVNEQKFVDEHLQPMLLKIREVETTRNFNKNGLLFRQQKQIIKREKIIASMYNEFLKMSKELKGYVDNDKLMIEGYLKHKAKSLISEKKASLRELKMSVL